MALLTPMEGKILKAEGGDWRRKSNRRSTRVAWRSRSDKVCSHMEKCNARGQVGSEFFCLLGRIIHSTSQTEPGKYHGLRRVRRR